MKLKEGITSEDRTEGFVKVEKFSGSVAKIRIDKLRRVIKLLSLLDEAGFESIEIGIEDGLMILFTTKDRSHGYTIAPLIGGE